jgi:hypothetical protein
LGLRQDSVRAEGARGPRAARYGASTPDGLRARTTTSTASTRSPDGWPIGARS